MQILSLDSLRTLYAQPQERAVKKQIAALDQHCESFIALSPFLILSTCDEDFNLDASPRGGDPGFVKVTTDGELLIPGPPRQQPARFTRERPRDEEGWPAFPHPRRRRNATRERACDTITGPPGHCHVH